jgi:hypothetical protein
VPTVAEPLKENIIVRSIVQKNVHTTHTEKNTTYAAEDTTISIETESTKPKSVQGPSVQNLTLTLNEKLK